MRIQCGFMRFVAPIATKCSNTHNTWGGKGGRLTRNLPSNNPSLSPNPSKQAYVEREKVRSMLADARMLRKKEREPRAPWRTCRTAPCLWCRDSIGEWSAHTAYRIWVRSIEQAACRLWGSRRACYPCSRANSLPSLKQAARQRLQGCTIRVKVGA